MIRIAVCDDNGIQLELIKEFYDVYINEHPGTIEVDYFSSGNELIESLENNDYDIFILDLVMPGINGIEVARILRNLKSGGKILFLSASKDYVFDAFSVKASDYLIKPITPENLFRKTESLIREINAENPKSIVVRTVNGISNIFEKDICFIENVNRAPCYHLLDGSVVEGAARREKFAEVVAPFLESDFAFCSVSSIVNIANVIGFDRDEGVITFKDKSEAYCSRSGITTISRAYRAYKKKIAEA